MRKSNRALRRQENARVRRKRVKYFVATGSSYRVSSARKRGILVTTATTCSCWACGHRRENEGATIQERRFLCESFEELP